MKSDKEFEDIHSFVDQLPHLLKIEVSKYLYDNTFKKLYFLKGKSDSFIAWICPLFKPSVVYENEYIYFEGDNVDNIYILQQGECGYVLPKRNNFKYINVT